MKENLKISVFENNPEWENPNVNLHQITKDLQNIDTDIIVLPEMFATGFSMNVNKIAQTEKGEIVQWMKDFSSQNNVAICGSVSINENEKYYNRFYFFSNGSLISQYDKHHLFSYGKENLFYTEGNKKVVFDYEGWKICPMICYDLRFPVWNRNTENYDILLNVANWPITRIETWKVLHKARAIENQCFALGVNRIGTDGNNWEFNGQSQCISPTGKEMFPKNSENNIHNFSLYKADITKIRNEFPFLDDRDSFEIISKK